MKTGLIQIIAVTVAVGVFVISQYILKLVLEPVTRVRRAIADVSSTVLFRQGKITNATHDLGTAEELRRASSQLRASISEVQCYTFLSRLGLFGIPSKSNARSACHCLNLLAGHANDPSKERSRLVDAAHGVLNDLGDLLNTETRY
jgi:hypothetical protein